MRKALAGAVLAVSVTGCLALYACSGGSSDATADAPASDAPQQATQQEPEQKSTKYAVSIDDCTVTTDYSDSPAIVVTYTFANDSDKAVPFMTAISAKAFQNGVQLDTAIVENIDAQSTMNEIKSGATTTVQQAYALDDESDVSVECTELISPTTVQQAYALDDESDVSVECTELISLDDTILAEKTFAVV